MNEEVADFGENESEERQSGLEHVRRSVQRMIDQISDPRRETPVITVRQREKKVKDYNQIFKVSNDRHTE